MTTPFDPTAYGSAAAELLADPRVPELGPGRPFKPAHSRLLALKLSRPCQAGMWLHFDFLNESHTISQSLETAEGSFWHAIMHRREPDAWNSKYWFRKVGPHPVLDQLVEVAPALGFDYTNPFDFVDFCERVRGTGTADEEVAKRVQQLEWQLLFDHSYQATRS